MSSSDRNTLLMGIGWLMLVLFVVVAYRVMHLIIARAKMRKIVNNTIIAIKKVYGTPPKWERPEGGFISLEEAQVRFMWEHSKCPYCHSSIYQGPQGGLSRNYFCGNPDCNSRFNITEPGMVAFGGATSGIPAWGEFTGEAPADFLEWRREEIEKERKQADMEKELSITDFNQGMLP